MCECECVSWNAAREQKHYRRSMVWTRDFRSLFVFSPIMLTQAQDCVEATLTLGLKAPRQRDQPRQSLCRLLGLRSSECQHSDCVSSQYRFFMKPKTRMTKRLRSAPSTASSSSATLLNSQCHFRCGASPPDRKLSHRRKSLQISRACQRIRRIQAVHLLLSLSTPSLSCP